MTREGRGTREDPTPAQPAKCRNYLHFHLHHLLLLLKLWVGFTMWREVIVGDWSAEDVGEWLRDEVKVDAEIVGGFTRGDVNGEALMELMADEPGLKELVPLPGPRFRVR